MIIPTYRRSKKLARAVDSVLAQSFEDWELIIVNDDPVTQVEHLLPEDERIRCIQHEENRGCAAARNTGIRASSGPYIAFLDDDDAWKPIKLGRQVDRFESLGKRYGLVYAGREIVEGDRVVEVEIPGAEGKIFEALLRSNVIPSPTPLVRAECFETVGLFDPELRSLQDLDMWLRIAKEYSVTVVPEALAVTYRGHDDRISQDPLLRYRAHKRILLKYKQEIEQDEQALANRHRLIGINATKLGKRKAAIKHLLISSRYVLHSRTAFYLALNLAPSSLHRPARRTAKRIQGIIAQLASSR